ncbi:MAG: hypothetical protein LAN62_01045 [Acidobacteriia bacterium]|nr:hypothetical protein [Terriglobia bacterium]
MPCPICEKRDPRRFCPARGDTICAICCGTEREVTIDCPVDCPYLIVSRRYDLERREVDWSKVPFADVKIPASFVAEHESFLAALSYAICRAAQDDRLVVDADVLAALGALVEAYRTLASGIYFERPPDYRVQREVYDAVRTAIEEFKKAEAETRGTARLRDGEIRDALIFLAQLGTTRANGRPKGRAFLDFLRTQFKSGEFAKPASNIVLLP